MPWRRPLCGSGGNGLPLNLSTRKSYRGINIFLLAMTAWEEGYQSDYWLTYRQAKNLGGSIKKGEKATLVTFWKLYEKEDKESGEEVTLPVLRHYNVFNAEQSDGIKVPDVEDRSQLPFNRLAACDAIVEDYQHKPAILHRAGTPRYYLSTDEVQIPEPNKFINPESYYSVLFHELVHSTGHEKRLDRSMADNPAPYGSYDYGKEELVAEMGAAFLSAVSDISPPTIEQSASYIENWRKTIKADKHLVIQSAGAAQKAADWILGDEHAPA